MYYLLKKIFQNMDYWLIGAVCLLAAFGMVCIASATHVNLGEGYDMVLKQFLFFASGIGLMIAASIIDYDLFSRYTLPLYLFNLALLIIVLLIGTGRDTSRWIAIGPLTLQPSEFCKIIMIFILSKLLSDHKDRVNELPFLFFILGISAVPTLLILKQPALSAAMVIVAITCILLFLAGLDYTYIRNVLIIAVPLLLFVLWDVSREDPLILDKILKPHQFNRILAFVDPSRDPSLYYQTEKSISAIGSGQLTGNGLFQGTLNQLSYLPEPQNDFIFSVIGEEFGFLGCIAVLGVLLFVVFRCIVIAISARDTFSQYLAAGVAGMFAFQTFVNVGVVTGILPNTGISLPFISYGGSSMWTNMIAIGLVQNICKRSSKSLFEGGIIMKIGLIAHDNKKKLMENLCIAYRHILCKHELYATGTTGRLVEDAANLSVHKYLSGRLGGEQQLGAQVVNNDIDLMIFLRDPVTLQSYENEFNSILRLCDTHNIPLATNLATAEVLLLALDRGDLDWRNIMR